MNPSSAIKIMARGVPGLECDLVHTEIPLKLPWRRS
jgi:hypothetical protein